MPVTPASEDWIWALCLHGPTGLLIWKLPNRTVSRFDHLERITEDHYTTAHDLRARTQRLTEVSA
jgi:hypothetical protein